MKLFKTRISLFAGLLAALVIAGLSIVTANFTLSSLFNDENVQATLSDTTEGSYSIVAFPGGENTGYFIWGTGIVEGEYEEDVPFGLSCTGQLNGFYINLERSEGEEKIWPINSGLLEYAGLVDSGLVYSGLTMTGGFYTNCTSGEEFFDGVVFGNIEYSYDDGNTSGDFQLSAGYLDSDDKIVSTLTWTLSGDDMLVTGEIYDSVSETGTVSLFVEEAGDDEDVSLVQMTSDSISSLVWFNEGTVDIQWSEGTTGGWFLSTSDVSGNVESIPSNCEESNDCVPVEEAGTGIQVELTTGMNNKYFCAFGLSGNEKQVVCFDSVVLIDDENPTITDVTVTTGDFFDDWYVHFEVAGFDEISGISGYILKIDGEYNDINANIILEQGTHPRTVVLEDKAGNRSEESTGSFEIAGDNSGGSNIGHGSAPRYVQFGDRVVYGSWTTNGRVDIEWLRGATGGWWFSTIGDASSVEIPSEGHYTGVTNGETSIQLTQSMNGKYICAFGQTGDTSPQVICSDHYVRIDNQHPEIELLSPSNGTEFYLGDGVSLSWSGSDGVSGISGYELTIRNSSSSVIMTRTLSSEYYNYTVSETGNLTWTIKACDFAMNCTEISRNFVALYTGTAVQGSGFYLIRPASGDVINLGSSIQFSWNPGNVNRGYNYEILKVGDNEWSISGSTDNTYVQINGSRFSEGTYSWSVKDIASDTVKSVPAFYVVENGDTPDLKVDQFEFDEKRNAEVDELYTSNEIRIRGLTNGRYVPVSLKDNKGSLRINGEFVGSRGYVRNNDRVYIELKASREHNTTVSATLLVGLGQNLVTGEFKVTTSENGAGGWDNSSLTPLQKLWGIVFVDSLVEMYQSNERKLAVFLSTFMQVLEDKVNEYDSLATEAEEDGDEDLASEYRLYKNALAFLYTIVEYRYNNIAVEEREVYIAPNGRQYLVEYDYDRMAYTSPDFAKPKYFPTWEQFTSHIDKNNPKSGNWGVAGNVITTHNGKTYTIYEVNGKWTSSNFATAKYFDSKEDIINHILANNPASSWDHDIDTNFIQVTYTAPNGRTYRIFKTSSDGNNPNMYSSYDFINAKYFTTLEAAKKYIRENNQK